MAIPQEINSRELPVLHNTRKELIVRMSGIILISMLFPVVAYKNILPEAELIKVFLVSLIRTALLWNGSMLIINYLVSRFSVFKEPVKLLVYQIVSLILFVFLVEVAEIYAIEHFLRVPLLPQEKLNLIMTCVLITFMISAIYASVAFFLQWRANMKQTRALEKATMEARYEVLRNQVNPHFLFNSLNTLLMLVGDNTVAARYVESVSEFMRYMLNSRDKEVVTLGEELKMAREYIFIQQNRFGGKLNVVFDVPESFSETPFPPLALQMLLENALKHNVISKENPLHIHIGVENNSWLVVANNFQPKIEQEPSTGVGLGNIRDRYRYLSGKEILILKDARDFVVKLPFFDHSARPLRAE